MKSRLIPGYEGECATRVLTGLDAKTVFREALKAWRDDEVTQITIHKPGSHLRLSSGEEIVVGFRPAELEPEVPGSSC